VGRQPWSSRRTVEECKSIDIPWLKQHGYFCGFKSGGIEWRNDAVEITSSIGIHVSVDESNIGGNYLRLIYNQTNNFMNEKTELDYKIELVTSPCKFGGVRYWFICPLMVNGRLCGRRVGKLYLPPEGKYFGCRNCYNLTYRCQKEHDSRVDALLKNPELLLFHTRGRDVKASLLAFKAFFKIDGQM
jgi:hypothetical protein